MQQLRTRIIACRIHTIGWLCAGLLALAGSPGCSSSQSTIQADDPQVASMVQMMMPRKVEIQRYLTRPCSVPAGGEANAVEVVLAAKDRLGDDVKCVGTYNFELFKHRDSSADRLGERVGFWSVAIDSEAALAQYWDRVTRFYNFRLELDEGKLPSGRYILSAQLTPAGADRLFDEYEFSHDAPASAK